MMRRALKFGLMCSKLSAISRCFSILPFASNNADLPHRNLPNRLGGSQALGLAYGTVFILISPKGANRKIITHEMAHIAVGRQLSSLALVSGRLPAWFFEGLAVIVSRDARYLTFPKGGYPDVALPSSFREWRRRAELEHAQLYPAAAFKVSQWMDQNDGVFGVRVALKALAEGEVINFN